MAWPGSSAVGCCLVGARVHTVAGPGPRPGGASMGPGERTGQRRYVCCYGARGGPVTSPWGAPLNLWAESKSKRNNDILVFYSPTSKFHSTKVLINKTPNDCTTGRYILDETKLLKKNDKLKEL